ncbi:MAG TPA: hypothetical protein VFS43_16090 [Polyangiaceae bacterium]|nr:hypothetical protein [Polyangiaceae bacterium]
MLPLSDLKPALLREVQSPRHARVFEAGRRRRAALAPYPAPEAVLARLWADGDGAFAERDRLTCALLAEQHARPAPLWCALLTLAYFPMLATLAGRLKRDGDRGLDVDDLVLHAFLDAAHALAAAGLSEFAISRLRQVTRRGAFRRLHDEREERRRQKQFVDELPDDVVDEAEVARWRREEADRTMRLLVARAPEAHRPGLDVLFATALEGETLEGYAARAFPGAGPEERARHAAALKRTRSRALARLREGFLRLG